MKLFFIILFFLISPEIFAHDNVVISGKINVCFHWDYSVEISETSYLQDEEISLSNNPFILTSTEDKDDYILKTVIETKNNEKIISFIMI